MRPRDAEFVLPLLGNGRCRMATIIWQPFYVPLVGGSFSRQPPSMNLI